MTSRFICAGGEDQPELAEPKLPTKKLPKTLTTIIFLSNQTKNYHYDHIPLNLKEIINPILGVEKVSLI